MRRLRILKIIGFFMGRLRGLLIAHMRGRMAGLFPSQLGAGLS